MGILAMLIDKTIQEHTGEKAAFVLIIQNNYGKNAMISNFENVDDQESLLIGATRKVREPGKFITHKLT